MGPPRLSHTSIISARFVGAVGLRLRVTDSVPSMLNPYKIESDPAEDASRAGPESTDEKQTQSPVLASSLGQLCSGRGRPLHVVMRVELALPITAEADLAARRIRRSQPTDRAAGH